MQIFKIQTFSSACYKLVLVYLGCCTPLILPSCHRLHWEMMNYVLTFFILFCFFHFPLQQVVSAVRAGVNPSGNSSNQMSLWDISSSFFFAGTVITTIGKWFLTLSPHSLPCRSFWQYFTLVTCNTKCRDRLHIYIFPLRAVSQLRHNANLLTILG